MIPGSWNRSICGQVLPRSNGSVTHPWSDLRACPADKADSAIAPLTAFLLAAGPGRGYKQGSHMTPTLIVVVVAVVVLAAIGAFLLFRSRPPKEEPIFHFNCPSCRRRLRYRAQQAGRQGACPQCKGVFTFPLAGK
jgi:hypothetical protein